MSINDQIDLEILNAAANIAAIIPLTPFVTTDGQGFLAPADQNVTFTSKDGVTLNVPAGAFSQLTQVTLHKLTDSSAFAAVPSFQTDMNFHGGVEIDFNCPSDGTAPPPIPCVANKRLDVTIPPLSAPAAGATALLGWLGQSVQGPRIMIVDTLRADANGNFTTTDATTRARPCPRDGSAKGAVRNANRASP